MDEDPTLEAVRALMVRTAVRAGLPESALDVREGPLPGYFGGTRLWNCVLTCFERSIAAVHVFGTPRSSQIPYRAFADELIARAVDTSRAASRMSQGGWLGYVVLAGWPPTPPPADGDGESADVATVLRQLLATRSLDAACLVTSVDDAAAGSSRVELPATFVAALEAQCLFAGAIVPG